MIQAGTTVRFTKMPEWVEACYGQSYRVSEIDGQGLFVLDVSAQIDPRFGGILNDIRLEGEFLHEIQ